MNAKITDKLVKSICPPENGYSLCWDTEQRGFGLRVTSSGTKSFILNYRSKGRERRFTIGSYPDWSVQAAREEAKELKREVDRGGDPLAVRKDERSAPTMSDLAKRYMEEHATNKRESSRRNDEIALRKHVIPRLGRIKVHDVTHSDVAGLHRSLKDRPYQANRVVALLGKMFSLAVKWELRPDNPARGIERYPEDKRNRYLSTNELSCLSKALSEHPNQVAANVVRFLLLTGARRGEVFNATWDHFDLAQGIWIKPSAHTKVKKEHRVPLSPAALQVLATMKETYPGSRYVFPGRLDGKPLQDIKKFWKQVCVAAQIDNCRLHDLRHTYASILASSGLSLPVIGALLGHTQPNTTARYAHLFDDPLREATERVASYLDGVASDDSASIISLDRS